VVDYQTVIEERFGMEVSKLSCYYPNWEQSNIVSGHKVFDRERAYFIPDVDYEIIIKPIKRKKQI
jgi:hypothetical protein